MSIPQKYKNNIFYKTFNFIRIIYFRILVKFQENKKFKENKIISIFKKYGISKVFKMIKRSIYLFLNDRDLFFLKLNYELKSLSSIYIDNINNEDQTKIYSNFDKQKVDLIIPWYGDQNIFKLIPNLFETDNKYVANIILINDKFPNEELSQKLKEFIRKINNKKIIYIEQSINKGFVGTINSGFKIIKNDCIILNSDILTTNNWIRKILLKANSDSKIATITPLSNNATIFSIPNFLQRNEPKNYDFSNSLLEKVDFYNGIEVPTGHGFCMYFRKKYLDQYGLLDEKTFGKGYGEENDICMRFYEHGLKNIALTNTYIVHLESQSFGNKQRENLIKHNYPKLLKKHPTYSKLIKSFIKKNPLKNLQKTFAFFQENSILIKKSSILIILHTNPFKIIGGVEIETTLLVKRLTKEYPDKQILIYFCNQNNESMSLFILDGLKIELIFDFDTKINKDNILKWIIKVFNIELSIIEHLMFHSLNYPQIIKAKKIKSILFIHDFYFYCQIPDLINYNGKYCNFETKNQICNKCLEKKLKKYVEPNIWKKNCKKTLSEEFDYIIFNSEYTLNIFRKIYKLPKKNNYLISYPK